MTQLKIMISAIIGMIINIGVDVKHKLSNLDKLTWYTIIILLTYLFSDIFLYLASHFFNLDYYVGTACVIGFIFGFLFRNIIFKFSCESGKIINAIIEKVIK